MNVKQRHASLAASGMPECMRRRCCRDLVLICNICRLCLIHFACRERWADCCQLLQSIMDKMLEQQGSLEVLGAHLQTILASMMASLQPNLPAAKPSRRASQASTSSTCSAGGAGSEEPLVKLVLRLTVQAPLGLHAYLRDVEPLLPLRALEPACRYLSSWSCFWLVSNPFCPVLVVLVLPA